MMRKRQNYVDCLQGQPEDAITDPWLETAEFCLLFLLQTAEIEDDPEKAERCAILGIRMAARHNDDLRSFAWSLFSEVQRTRSEGGWAEVAQFYFNLYWDGEFRLVEVLVAHRNFPGAEKVARCTISCLRDGHSRGCGLAVLGEVQRLAGDVNRAISKTTEALWYLDAIICEETHSRAVYELATALCQTGWVEAEVGNELKDIRRERYVKGSRQWAQHRWLEGLVLKARNHTRHSIKVIEAARRALLDHGTAKDNFLITLHLAELYMESGASVSLKQLLCKTLAFYLTLPYQGAVIKKFIDQLNLLSEAAYGDELTLYAIRCCWEQFVLIQEKS